MLDVSKFADICAATKMIAIECNTKDELSVLIYFLTQIDNSVATPKLKCGGDLNKIISYSELWIWKYNSSVEGFIQISIEDNVYGYMNGNRSWYSENGYTVLLMSDIIDICNVDTYDETVLLNLILGG